MAQLWKKTNSGGLHPLIQAYTVGTDWQLDVALLPYDVEASKAHAQMLGSIELLTSQEVEALCTALDEIASAPPAISIEDEDCHTVIENALVAKLGDVGKKIHTGRSRNDQVLVAMRLYMRDHLEQMMSAVEALAQRFAALAMANKDIPMPGYTHTQQAMLSSVGHWFASFAEALQDDLAMMKSVHAHIKKNPLGSAAGFGVSIPLDRTFTTEKLGFASTQMNSLYCQSSRGKFESLMMEALSQVMMTLGKFATDLILFTTQEFAFFKLDDSIVTGSSIMPQKRNLDVMEIMRGQGSVILGNKVMIQDLGKGLISGYHRDLQLLKKPLMESVEIVETSLAVLPVVLDGITVNATAIEAKMTKEMTMADLANQMVKEEGIPFRDAYKMAAERLKNHTPDWQANLNSKVSPGAPGNLGLN